MKDKGKLLKLLFAMVLACLLAAGCGSGGETAATGSQETAVSEAADTEENTKETAEEQTQEDKQEKAEDALAAENEIPEDGIITQAQMESIAGKEGEYRFCGKTEDGISYTWIYEGSKIQNPVEQKLKVEFTSDGLDEIKEKAENPAYALQVQLQEMELAAPATLEVTLTEKWDADRVLYCIYEDETIYKLDEASIEDAATEDGAAVSKLRFQVTKANGGVYVLLGGSSEGDSEDTDTRADAQTAVEDESGYSEEGADQGTDASSDTGNEAGTESSGDSSESSESTEPETHTCTISIECSAILDNWDDLKDTKAEFVPSDGWILYPSEISFEPGDTVFDVLKDACSQAGIQMSSRYTPLYGSYYIEGINQLYEFDCGSNSGWMYSVNGWFPNYGASSYTVEDGDQIEWRYTCDLGSDVGNGYGG